MSKITNTFVKLTQKQLEQRYQFIKNYLQVNNAAEGSNVDANANVATKNVATLRAEINKDIDIQVKRYCVSREIEKLFGKELADEYNRQIEAHEIYVHDESAVSMPYCVSITMYPFLLKGLKGLGGDSVAPKHLTSFCGGFINLAFAISSQFAGAVATVEYLLCFDYFARKDYGENYLETHKKDIENAMQQVVYSINQPASARGYQCVREDTTQLATPEGFKYLSELNVGDKCYVWKNGKLSIETIKKLNVYDYDGELIQFKGRNYQQTVTPNHRVLYKKPNSNEYDIREAKNLVGHSKLSLPIGSEGIDSQEYPISDDILKLLVAVLTDGTIEILDKDNLSSSRIRIYKSKKRYGYKEIANWLDNSGIGYTIKECSSNSFGEMVVFKIDSINSQILLRLLKHTKKEIPFFFNLLSKRQAKLVIDEWAKFDGSTLNDEAHLLQCDNIAIQNQLQQIALLAGYGSELYEREMRKFSKDEPCIVRYLKVFKRTDKRVKTFNKIQYKGKVWCPTTDAGVVVFREENGIPYISGNSIFWNISLFDKYYLESLFGEFVYPDFSKPNFESVMKLQEFFINWQNEERRKALLTFPVVTAAMVVDENGPKDEAFVDMLSDVANRGASFFNYESDSVDSLASCCRLRNELQDNTFSYSLGAGGTQSGSLNVITININRLVQNAKKENKDYKVMLKEQVEKIHKYQVATKEYYKHFLNAQMLDAYREGYIDMDKQFLTVGINGVLEAAEFSGLTPNNNDEYKKWTSELLKVIFETNKEGKQTYGIMFNTEFVPAENLGVKNYNWDKSDGYVVPENRVCYNSYLYRVEDIDIDPIDKFFLHGRENLQYLDGGSALHLNLEEYPTKETYKKLYSVAAKTGCNYWTWNVLVTCCEEPDCGYIDKRTLDHCSRCGSKNVSWATRIIGYLRKTKNYTKERQKEASLRAKANINRIDSSLNDLNLK